MNRFLSLFTGDYEGLSSSQRTMQFFVVAVFVLFFVFFFFTTVLSHLDFSISRATKPTVHAGSFSVSIIHQTLTWTTGSLTCVYILMHAVAHEGVPVS